MKSVTLGCCGAVVSRMGLGCMGMGEFHGGRDGEESAAEIEAAVLEGEILGEGAAASQQPLLSR